MLFTCRCLNASVEAILDRPLEETLVWPDGRLAFMRLVVRNDGYCSTRLPASLGEEPLAADSWTLRRCLVCRTAVYASSVDWPNEVLVSRDMLHDEDDIAAVQRSENYSSIFKVLLPVRSSSNSSSASLPADEDHRPVDGLMNTGEDYSLVANGNNAGVVYVHQVASDYLRRQRDEMEERIRCFIDDENARFDEKRTQVKAERSLLARHLLTASAGQSESGNDQGATSELEAQRRRSEGGGDLLAEVNDGSGAVVLLSASPLQNSTLMASPTAETTTPTTQGADKSDASNVGALTVHTSSDSSTPVVDDLDLHFGEGTITFSDKPKRVRHSGGTGKAPKLVSQGFDSQGILFFMDDCEVIYAEPQMPADDDGETDDIAASTASEEGSNKPGALYKTSALKRSSVVPYGYSPSRGCKALGTSLPVTIPGMTSRTRPYEPSDSEDEDYMPEGDLATSIYTLALTMQEADAPERLFGERPSRYRYRRRHRHQPM